MFQNISMTCDTKSCTRNDKGICKEKSIVIKAGKCISIRPKNRYNADGTRKEFGRGKTI